MQSDLPLAPPIPVDVRATSREVFETIRKDGSLSRAQLRALEILVDAAAPLTGAEVDGLDQSTRSAIGSRGFRGHLHKRLPELRSVGVIVEGDARVCRVTGHKAITWVITGRQPVKRAERKVPQATRIKDLERENARLTRRVRELERDLGRARQTSIEV